ncbi:MAG: tetratricopeptide repeat protein, partial [Burkholderiales bacterium]
MANPRHRLVALVIAALAVLATATALLASIHHEARDALVDRHFARGNALVEQGQPAAAIGEYRAALSLGRDRLAIERALALTLLSVGRISEAESYLRDLLLRDPVNGPLNRGMARVHAH